MQIKFLDHPKQYNSKVAIFFVDNTFTLPLHAKKIDDGRLDAVVSTIVKSRLDFNGKSGQSVALNIPDGFGVELVILIGTGDGDINDDNDNGDNNCNTQKTDNNVANENNSESSEKPKKKKKITSFSLRKDGEFITSRLNLLHIKNADIYMDHGTCAASVAFGMQIGNYNFNKYFHAKANEHKTYLESVNIYSHDKAIAAKNFEHYSVIAESKAIAADFVNEPGNVIYPEVLAEKCIEYAQYGVNVRVLDAQEMRNLGMMALLGVAQGSVHEAKLIIMEWWGDIDSKDTNTVALIGKGVTFDSGGLSLKSDPGIRNMKSDMAGGAAVIGTIVALAKRKAKANVVGIIGAVENMPSGTAQRPDDIVRSMSRQTVEIKNTDAEGRLVLIDAVYYAQQTYKPIVMLDIATLTGAIVVALGNAYAGLFSMHDELVDKIIASGKYTGEMLWRMPMCDEYDKQINSKVADFQNVGQQGSGASSSTAAHFIARVVDKNIPWAHLDIAGVATQDRGSSGYGGATGFGVVLLNHFIFSNYEKEASLHIERCAHDNGNDYNESKNKKMTD